MLGDAVLADLRPLPSILRVLTNALEELPSEWTVHMVHGDAPPLMDPANDATAVMAIRRATGDGRLRFRHVATVAVEPPVGVDTVSYWQSRAWYNRRLLTAKFWKAFDRSHVLLFEADAAFCPLPSRPLESFARYAYVGAPWGKYPSAKYPHWCRNLRSCVGNSGFSLWKRGLMVKLTSNPLSSYLGVIEQHLRLGRSRRGAKAMAGPTGSIRYLYEARVNWSESVKEHALRHFQTHIDVWASVLLQSLEGAGVIPTPTVPETGDAAFFSVETTYSVQTPWTPVGVHKPARYLSPSMYTALVERCPAANRTLTQSSSQKSFPRGGRLASRPDSERL